MTAVLARTRRRARLRVLPLSVAAVCCCLAGAAQAVILPETRADALYHYYDGGDVKVTGPAVLVRQNIADTVSVAGRYYADHISSASIDVVTQASPYKDKRDEWGVNVDYLHKNTIVGLGMTTSKESDYLSDTLNLTMAHEIFGGMTTVSLGYSQSEDVVTRVDTDFKDHVNRYSYRLGVSQVLSKSWLLSLDYEAVLDEGFLNNPYRYARVQGVFVEEHYPRTRDSNTIALRTVYGLGSGGRLGSALRADYRFFWDTWDIRAQALELGYRLRGGLLGADHWTSELRYRYYTQNAASFYSDDFPQQMQYMARDKELSTFRSHVVGLTLDRAYGRWSVFERSSVGITYDFARFRYDDFTDVRNGQPYGFDAHIIQLLLSLWY